MDLFLKIYAKLIRDNFKFKESVNFGKGALMDFQVISLMIIIIDLVGGSI